MSFEALYPRVTRTRRIEDLCGVWDFQFDPEGTGEESGWAKDGLPDPIGMPVPASFADVFTDKTSREYTGDLWYARRVFVPGEWRQGNVDLRFDGATHRADVFCNGQHVAFHEGGFTPFLAHLNEVVRWNDWNLVAVRVNNELSLGSLPCGATWTSPAGVKMAVPYFDFFNYAGLQRPVRLLASPIERIEDVSFVPAIDGPVREGKRAAAHVDYVVSTTGAHEVEVTLVDQAGVEVARSQGVEGTLTLESARLWDVRDAYLYTAYVRIVDGETILDEWYDTLGVRTVHIEGHDILLNGRPVYLKGFGRHEDSNVHGRGFDPVMNKRDFEIMKWIGANSFRTSHYPYAEEQLYEADREGFLVIDEVAAVGFMKSTKNFLDAAKAKDGKLPNFFEDPEVLSQTLPAHRQALRELVARDKNHACVIAWSLMNEPDTSDAAALPYAEQIFDLAAELDPQGRPRSYTNVTRARAGVDTIHHLADFMMLNRYDGWYVLGGPRMHEAEQVLRDEMEQWHELEPDKPFVFTEYGTDTVQGMHKLPSVMWSEEYQKEFYELQHRIFDSYDWVVGEQTWNLCDFQTGEGIMRVDGNKKGVFTRDRQPKMIAYLLRDRWTSIPDCRD